MIIKTPGNLTKFLPNLRKKQIQIFLNFLTIFSKKILEKPQHAFTM